MLRFLSRRKVRNNYVDNASGTRGGPGAGSGGGGVIASSSGSQIKPQRIVVNKNKIDCRVILLDNTDLSIELSVSIELQYSYNSLISMDSQEGVPGLRGVCLFRAEVQTFHDCVFASVCVRVFCVCVINTKFTADQ